MPASSRRLPVLRRPAPLPATIIDPASATDAAAPRANTALSLDLTDVFDPTGLGRIPQVPLLPEALRRHHQVFVETDPRFRAAARFLQAIWRVDRGLPIGVHEDPAGRRRKLGSRLSVAAGNLGANFIDPAILPVVNRELVYRELGAVYELDRLKSNLLSSQPLVFNAFALLKRDLALATRVMAELLPGFFIHEVTDILFEHSPGRGDVRFTADGTAFDFAIRGRTATGQRAFVGGEMKYSESCQEPLPRFSGRFDQIAPSANLFVDPLDPRLRTNPVQQFFRQSCLAATILDQGLADVAVSVLLAPSHNHSVQAAAATYAGQLIDPSNGRIPFINLTLETLFGALAAAGQIAHAQALHKRYTDFWLVDGELELDPSPGQVGITFVSRSPRTMRAKPPRPAPGTDAVA